MVWWEECEAVASLYELLLGLHLWSVAGGVTGIRSQLHSFVHEAHKPHILRHTLPHKVLQVCSPPSCSFSEDGPRPCTMLPPLSRTLLSSRFAHLPLQHHTCLQHPAVWFNKLPVLPGFVSACARHQDNVLTTWLSIAAYFPPS